MERTKRGRGRKLFNITSTKPEDQKKAKGLTAKKGKESWKASTQKPFRTKVPRGKIHRQISLH